jgi:TIR domain
MSKTLKNHTSLDVFISYRRDGGASVAAFVHKELQSRGLRVFMDVKELETGDYKAAIEKNIKASKTFLLLVTETVFKSDSVLLEIKTALSSKTNILPIFINNLETFPEIPESISKIGNINGITLNHRNFEDTLNELFTKITSRKDEILFKVIESYNEDNSEYLVGRVNNFDSRFKKKLLEFTKQYIRELAHDRDFSKSNAVIEDIFKTSIVSKAKKIAKELVFDHRGSMSRIVVEARNWITQGDKYINESLVDDKKDRYEYLSDKLVIFYQKLERRNRLKEKFKLNEIEPYAGNSAGYIYYLMDHYYILGDLFNFLDLSENEFKELLSSMFEGQIKGRLKDLTEYLCDWVDYKY